MLACNLRNTHIALACGVGCGINDVRFVMDSAGWQLFCQVPWDGLSHHHPHFMGVAVGRRGALAELELLDHIPAWEVVPHSARTEAV